MPGETQLDVFDIGVPIPPAQRESQSWFRFLLLSRSDLQKHLDATMDRVERLYCLGGGQQVGILFLLNTEVEHGSAHFDMMDLQTRYVL